MADKRRLLDVWIVDTKTVYREVPYSVVTDWVQQGRLLESDRLRASGTQEWKALVDLPDFAVYLPKSEPYRAEDKAEALEPVEVDFSWKHPATEEEGDPDMIPLIDVSLVLLLFFMMTASVATAAALVNTPEAQYGTQVGDPQMYAINITPAVDGTPLYALSQGDQTPSKEKNEMELTEAGVLQLLDQRLQAEPGRIADVQVKADRSLPYEVVKKMITALDVRRGRGMLRKAYAGVSERENP
jgi:biopolymer transport protein ExbD